MPATPSRPQDHLPEATSSTGHPDPVANETVRLSLAEETLEAHIVEADRGTIRIHRRVETEPVQASVDLHQDHYLVDRVEVNEFAAERREPWFEGDTLVVPVYEEVLVTETKLMLREVVRLRNVGDIEQVNLKGTVRREVVDIEEINGDGNVSQPEEAG
jgi:stress response protein YsnF